MQGSDVTRKANGVYHSPTRWENCAWQPTLTRMAWLVDMDIEEVLPRMVEHVLSAFHGDRPTADADIAAALTLFVDVRQQPAP